MHPARLHAVEEHDELIAAMTAYVSPFHRLLMRRPRDVVRTQAAREPLRDDTQQVVANRVSQRIVDALELVEVEEHDRERRTVAIGSLEGLGQLFVEARAVRELRDHVEVSEAMDLLDRAGALGGILDRSRETDDAAGGAQQCFAEHMHMAQLLVLSEDAHVESFQYIAPCKLDEPAAERPAIILVNEMLDRSRARTELRRIHAEDPEHLTRADDVVGRALPFPASDPGDSLRARQLLRQVAAGGIFTLGRLVRGLESSSPCCRPSRPVDFVSVKDVASSRLAPKRPSAARNPATERAMRRPTTASAALDNPSAASAYANALIQPPVSKGNSNACASATAAIACPVKLYRNAAGTLRNHLPAEG